jgi:hypothetical protein
MLRPSKALLAVGLSCLALSIAACGTSTPSTPRSVGATRAARRYLVLMSHLGLRRDQPAHVTFRADAATLRVFLAAESPLSAHALERVSAPPASRVLDGGVIHLQGSRHTGGGETVYALLTTEPLSPGWYRLELRGEGDVVSLSIDEH